MTSSCYGSALMKARSEAFAIYNNISSVPATNQTDPTFVSWASTGFPDYMNAYTACQQATIAYYAAIDSNNGDDAGVYTAARVHVEPLVDDSTS